MEIPKFIKSKVRFNSLILYDPGGQFTTLAAEGQLGKEKGYGAGKSNVKVRVISHPRGGKAHVECTFFKKGKDTPQVSDIYQDPGDPSADLPGGGRVQHLK